MSLRIRQIVLASHDLAAAVEQTEALLGLKVVHRDPEVAKFGLENALLALGDQFLEIVSPTRANTAAGRHLDRHGDSAYMLILQTDDLARDRARIEKLGVRIVWESNYDDMCAIHLHPKDVGGAIVSIDQATPRASWRWAGPTWQPDNAAAGHIVDATIATLDPAALAARWSTVLGTGAPREAAGAHHLDIEAGQINFVTLQDGGERITEFGVRGFSLAKSANICGAQFVRRD